MGGEKITNRAHSPSSPRKPQDDKRKDEPYAFQFIEVGEPSKGRRKDEGSRSAIRAHVMRDFHEKRLQQRRPSDQLPVIVPAPAQFPDGTHLQESTHRFRVSAKGLQEVKRGTRRRKSVKPNDPPPDISGSIGREHSARDGGTEFQFVHSMGRTLVPKTSQDVAEIKVHRGGQITPLGQCHGSGTASDAVRQAHIHPEENHELAVFASGEKTVLSRLGMGMIDPFDCLPGEYSPRVQELLYFANQGIFTSHLMGQLRREWLSLATQDPAMFNVALSHYAGNYGLTRQANDPIEALRFRMEALSIINRRIETPSDALTDGNIGAIASLASYEATCGHLDAIKTHSAGLKKLIKMRGGLDKAGLNQNIKRLILWSDLNCAVALGTTPVHLNSDNTASSTPILPPEERHSPLERAHQTAKDTEQLGKELLESLAQLRTFITLSASALDKSSTTTISRTERIKRSDQLLETERKLLFLANKSGPRKFLTGCCLASIIFLDNHLRGVAFNARIMDRIISRLQISMNLVLGSVDIGSLSHNTRCAMVWVLSVGAVANTVGRWQERECLCQALVAFCDVMGWQKFEELESVLKSFLWPEEWDTYAKELWERIEDLRLEAFVEFPDVPV